jgi:FtsP/CotA-like multicopper oxidase with cupredoxin domain
MDRQFRTRMILSAIVVLAAIFGGVAQATGGTGGAPKPLNLSMRVVTAAQWRAGHTTAAMRAAAAKAVADERNSVLGKLSAGLAALTGAPKAAVMNPGGTPDYFGTTPNFANSPLPTLDASGNPVPGTGIRKFVDSLPGLNSPNDLGQQIPIAVPNTTMYPGADYYVIALVRYQEKLSTDLPPTWLQGYVQCNPTSPYAQIGTPQYAGPAIVAQRNKPVRVKFINRLPTGTNTGSIATDGNLFLPVDTTVMGAGMGPRGGMYSQNRANLHLHGGVTPWISDGTPHQWTTPAGQVTTYTEGVSVYNVPDMDGGHEPTGTLTFYYTNAQSARLMFYHDHTYGLTRLDVYAGEAAPFILQDPVEQILVNGGTITTNGVTVSAAPSTIPTEQIPLVIQDKTFVPGPSQLASEDPTWDPAHWGGLGNLWLPHVYMTNQNPASPTGINPMGRWDYNPWFYPPVTGQTYGPVANPLYNPVTAPWENAQNPGTPNPTIIPESFMDTPLVNGTAYPYLKVQRKAYRFRILNACDDRTLDLQIYFAKSNTATVDVNGNPILQTVSGEVPTIAAAFTPTLPVNWPVDGRAGGVPDPAASGPSMIQIGNEGGFLPSAAVLPNVPVGYEYFRRTITVLNVTNHTLLLGPAERADIIVDFSGVPAGSKLILYNDAPAPMPGFDARNDYYTGDPNQTSSGGAPTTQPGYGPNTRTIMQFDVQGGSAAATFSVPALQTALQKAYAASQDKPLIPGAQAQAPNDPNDPAGSLPMPVYDSVYATSFAPVWDTVLNDTTMTFKPYGSTSTTVSLPIDNKAIIEGFDMDYGRMNANLGGTLPNNPGAVNVIPYDYAEAPTEFTTQTLPGTQVGAFGDGTEIWRIDHQGVDTHSIHVHLFNVELINRVAIDGQVFYPDPNEAGWKETVRMNPGQDVIVALRPVMPTNLPFKLPDSIRPMQPSLPIGATFISGAGNGTITNAVVDYGWEYVWHCHLLGHEENDMMRPIVFSVAPAVPTGLKATLTAAGQATLSWTNAAVAAPFATDFVVQRATNAAFTAGVATFTVNMPALTLVNGSLAAGTYYYRVRAESAIAFSPWSAAVTVAVTGPSVTIRASASTILLGQSVTLSGTARPYVAGATINLYMLRPGAASFVIVSRPALTSPGNWTYTYRPTLRGRYAFYPTYGGVRATSVIVTVQ